MSRPTIMIAGAGGIGQAVALLIAEQNAFEANIYLGDIDVEKANNALLWIQSSVPSEIIMKSFQMAGDGLTDEMKEALEKSDVLLDCLPGSLAPTMASYAMEYKLHYANLTEYVRETDEIVALTQQANTGFILQTGLAPGYINVLAMQLYNKFTSIYEVDTVDRLSMKVGALTRNAQAPHFYGFTWSPIGVATEYLKDAWVVRDSKKTTVPALSETEKLILDGVHYEDDYTSGGAADLPDALAGKVRALDYKTIRYPGHYDWVRRQLTTIPQDRERVQELEERMLNNIPRVEDDIVVIYAAVTGKDAHGNLHKIEKSLRIPPIDIGRTRLRAIQATTAAPMVECARMLVEDKYKGPVFQSQIDPDSFLSGPFVKRVYQSI